MTNIENFIDIGKTKKSKKYRIPDPGYDDCLGKLLLKEDYNNCWIRWNMEDAIDWMSKQENIGDCQETLLLPILLHLIKLLKLNAILDVKRVYCYLDETIKRSPYNIDNNGKILQEDLNIMGEEIYESLLSGCVYGIAYNMLRDSKIILKEPANDIKSKLLVMLISKNCDKVSTLELLSKENIGFHTEVLYKTLLDDYQRLLIQIEI